MVLFIWFQHIRSVLPHLLGLAALILGSILADALAVLAAGTVVAALGVRALAVWKLRSHYLIFIEK